jgi:hypothetical protein
LRARTISGADPAGDPEARPPVASDPRYAVFFDCFNRQRFYEAHEALEPLWLERRGQPGAAFYKGLIQLAGAFLHLQNNRLDPAARLLRLAAKNLRPFGPRHKNLDVVQMLLLVGGCLASLENSASPANPYDPSRPPTLKLEAA